MTTTGSIDLVSQAPIGGYQVDPSSDFKGTYHKAGHLQQNFQHSHAQPLPRLEASPLTLGQHGHKHLPPFRKPNNLSARKSVLGV